MTGGRALTGHQNERVRELLLELLERYDNNQSKLAPLLGVAQPTLSAFISGRQGSSFPVALRICELGGWDVFEVLGIGAPTGLVERPLRALPGFDAALAEAMQRYPYVPASTWRRVGDWHWASTDAPPVVTPEFLHDAARLLLAHVPPTTKKTRRP